MVLHNSEKSNQGRRFTIIKIQTKRKYNKKTIILQKSQNYHMYVIPGGNN